MIKIFENLSKITNLNFLMWLAYCTSCDSLVYLRTMLEKSYALVIISSGNKELLLLVVVHFVNIDIFCKQDVIIY